MVVTIIFASSAGHSHYHDTFAQRNGHTVYVYLAVITIMGGIFAAFRGSLNKLVLYGAILFIASDSTIAINNFLTPVPASDYLVMVTYYLLSF